MLPGPAEHELGLFGASVYTIRRPGFKKGEYGLPPPEMRRLLDTL